MTHLCIQYKLLQSSANIRIMTKTSANRNVVRTEPWSASLRRQLIQREACVPTFQKDFEASLIASFTALAKVFKQRGRSLG